MSPQPSTPTLLQCLLVRPMTASQALAGSSFTLGVIRVNMWLLHSKINCVNMYKTIILCLLYILKFVSITMFSILKFSSEALGSYYFLIDLN